MEHLYRRWEEPRCWFGDLAVLAFLVVQSLDGVFTYVGVTFWGPGIEANPILSWYIAAFGAGAALFAAKCLAIGCAVLLYRFARYRTIGALTVMYFAMAVQPWVSLLIAGR